MESTAKESSDKGKKEKTVSCTQCGFVSKRGFNVIRHWHRIHGESKKKIECCGLLWLSKGSYYTHCADKHPDRRRSMMVTTSKYKIGNTREEKENDSEPQQAEENGVQVVIIGDSTSTSSENVVSEYLSDINFESFKVDIKQI